MYILLQEVTHLRVLFICSNPNHDLLGRKYNVLHITISTILMYHNEINFRVDLISCIFTNYFIIIKFYA